MSAEDLGVGVGVVEEEVEVGYHRVEGEEVLLG